MHRDPGAFSFLSLATFNTHQDGIAGRSIVAPDPSYLARPTLMSSAAVSSGDFEFLSHLLQAVRDSVIYTDLEGRVRYWNQGATEIFGYAAEEVLGGTVAVLYPEEDPARFASDLSRILGGEEFSGEWRGRRIRWPRLRLRR